MKMRPRAVYSVQFDLSIHTIQFTLTHDVRSPPFRLRSKLTDDPRAGMREAIARGEDRIAQRLHALFEGLCFHRCIRLAFDRAHDGRVAGEENTKIARTMQMGCTRIGVVVVGLARLSYDIVSMSDDLISCAAFICC